MHNENHTGALLKQATEPEETAEVSPGQNTGFWCATFSVGAAWIHWIGTGCLRQTPPFHLESETCSQTSSLDAIISNHMLKMAWRPPRQPEQIRAKQSTDFPHNSVYSPQNHADTSFSNMSGKGSLQRAQGQTQPFNYDVGLRRPRRK